MTSYNITKLADANYATWSVDMKFLLMEKGVWDIVIEKTPKPPPLITVEGTAPDKELAKIISDYNLKSQVALSTIYLNISEQYRKIIENLDCPVEAWKNLSAHYQPDSRAASMTAFSELLEARIGLDESVLLFAARILKLFNRVKETDPTFSEKYASFQLLRYLPQKFDTTVQNILRWSDEKFVFNKVTEELNAEEIRQQLRDHDISAATAVATVRPHYNCMDRQPAKSFQCDQCYQCGRTQSFSRGKPATSNMRRQPHRPERYGRITRNRSRQRKQQSQMPDRSNSKRGISPPACKSSVSKSSHFISCNMSSVKVETSAWVFDTAASHHFCKDRNLFWNFKVLNNETLSVAIDGIKYPIEGKGTIKLRLGGNDVDLNDVMYSSKLRKNLLSGPRFDLIGGCEFKGGGGRVIVSTHEGKTLLKAYIKDGIYSLEPKVIKPSKSVTFAVSKNEGKGIGIWHKRFAHVNTQTIIQTSKTDSVRGLPSFRDNEIYKCEPCKLNKHRRVSFKPIKAIRSKAPLNLLHADVWGPHNVTGRMGERYFLAVTDDYSRKVALFPFRDKTEVTDLVINHITRVETFLGSKVKAFRSDQGSEFTNRRLENFFRSKGIKHELTNPYTPEQNGVSERFNQTVAAGARTVLNESGIPLSFWPEAMLYFTYTWNRVCHSKLRYTPFELFGGTKPSVRHLKSFGALAYVGVPRQRRGKLDARAKKGYLVGYAFKTKGYRIWLPSENKIIETINVSFDENTLYKQVQSGAVLEPETTSNPASTIPLGSYESQTSEDSENDDDPSGSGLRSVNWIRKPVKRKMSSRTDIFYYEEGSKIRLRSMRDVENHCNRNNLVFNKNLFNFSGKDKTKGLIQESESEDDQESISSKLRKSRPFWTNFIENKIVNVQCEYHEKHERYRDESPLPPPPAIIL